MRADTRQLAGRSAAARSRSPSGLHSQSGEAPGRSGSQAAVRQCNALAISTSLRLLLIFEAHDLS